jgi:hypothetical protein
MMGLLLKPVQKGSTNPSLLDGKNPFGRFLILSNKSKVVPHYDLLSMFSNVRL